MNDPFRKAELIRELVQLHININNLELDFTELNALYKFIEQRLNSIEYRDNETKFQIYRRLMIGKSIF